MSTEKPDPLVPSSDGGPDPDPGAQGVRPDPSRWQVALREIATGNVLVMLLSVLLAIIVGSLMILATDAEVRETVTYLTARPSDFLWAVREAITGAYSALFRGAVFNTRADDFANAIKPLTETLRYASPLIAAGLGVGLAFRAGLFNIGGRGQMAIAAGAAGLVATNLDLPGGLHLVLAVAAGLLGGAVWAGIAGLLKARTGAHEVIVTIMLNYVGYYLLFYALSQPGLLQAPGSANPKSAPVPESAQLPRLLPEPFNLHLGFVLALLAVGLVWWLVNRSAWGFRARAVGENPDAARAAGIDVGRTYTTVMLVAGALVGLASVDQVLGSLPDGVTTDIDGGIGFDAITVALLGRSRPLGILAAGLLFGAFKAGGYSMRTAEQIPVDIVLVVQSLIVLFIAAPPLVKAIFRLPSKEAA